MELNKNSAPKTDNKKKKKDKPKKTVGQEIMSWVWTILIALLIATAIRAFVAEPVRVDGTSMTNTLQDGEVMLISKLAYEFGSIQRNDVVVCRYPGRVTGEFNLGASLGVTRYTIFVKRVVALPGDTVEIAGGSLYVNGELVPDPEKMASVPRDFPAYTLGEDEYFVIGDNRRTSHDSRASDVGPLSRNMILGKATAVIFPFNAWRSIK